MIIYPIQSLSKTDFDICECGHPASAHINNKSGFCGTGKCLDCDCKEFKILDIKTSYDTIIKNLDIKLEAMRLVLSVLSIKADITEEKLINLLEETENFLKRNS